MKRLSIVIFILCVTCMIHAATYFCSPTGNADGLSYNTPCSFSNGLSKLSNPGDTLYLLGGQYNLGNTKVSDKNGNSRAYIVISGYPGETAILDFRTTSYGTRGLQIQNNCTYLHVKDLTLRYSGKNNLYNEGSYCLFERLDIYGSSDTGCQMKKGGHNTIKNVDSHDNFDYQHYNSSNLADFGGNADGFADKQFTGPGNHYIGCRAWNNSDDGWDFYQRVSTSESVLENCICYQNGPAEYDMRNHPRYQTDKSWFDQINGTTVTSRYNEQITVTLEHYPNMGNGNGFKLGGDYTNHNVLIHHCLAVSNTVRGFDQNNNGGTMRVFNNTSYANGRNFGFYANDAHPTLSIRNNISFPTSAQVDISSTTLLANDHNTWNSSTGVTVTASDFVSLDTTQILGTRLPSGEFSMTVFHPAAGSDLIDAGVNVGLTYMGSAPDLGWYETPGDTVPVQPVTGRPVAWVSDGSGSDWKMLERLIANDSIAITELSSADASNDYSGYEAIVISPAPNSSAAAFPALKGYNKPILVLKPFLFKPAVWNWGTAVNTQDLSITISDTTHPIFENIEINSDGTLQLFSECNTNAVTAISAWTGASDQTEIASPVSHPGYSTVTEFPVGSSVSGTTLTAPLLMIGVSEYSTTNLTDAGVRLIENAVCYLLGIDTPSALTNVKQTSTPARKYFHNGHLYIRRQGILYDALGRRIK